MIAAQYYCREGSQYFIFQSIYAYSVNHSVYDRQNIAGEPVLKHPSIKLLESGVKLP